MTLLRTSWTMGKWCAGCARDLLLFALWLALAGLLALQVYLASLHQLPVPDWMLRQIESRLALSGLRAQIGTAIIDPAGRVVLENLQLYQVGASAPLATVETLNLRLSPWALLYGRVEASYVRGSGVDFLLPALLSPTGSTEPVISGVNLAFKPESGKLTLDQLTGHLANLTFSCYGAAELPGDYSTGALKPAQTGTTISQIVKKYINFCQRLAAIESELQSLESPHLDLRLSPPSSGAARATLTLTSENADFDLSQLKPEAGRVHLSHLRASTVLPLGATQANGIHVRASCTEARSSTGYEIRDLLCDLTVDLAPDFAQVIPQNLVATASSVLVNGVSLEATVVRLNPGPSPTIQAELITRAIGADWHIDADADPKLGQGSLAAEGALTPFIVQQVEKRINQAPGSILKLSAPAPLAFSVEFGAGWKPLKITGRISSGPIVAGSVPVNSVRGSFSYSNDELHVTDIVLHQGEARAEGIYWMNAKTLDYRFLLTGHLRPIGIAGWFGGWWPRFWGHFDFAPSSPVADVTVDGRWGEPNTTIVFVGAEVARPAILDVPFDRVRTTMFIRPDFYDALEVKVTKGDRSAQGAFSRAVDLTRDADALRTMDFDITSNLDLTETAKLFGQEGSETVEPFAFSNPPSLHVTGHIDGGASAKGPHRSVQMAVQSSGGFSLFDFPLNDLSFHGTIRDHDIDLNDVQVSFARGQAQCRAYLSGPESERRLSFDCALEGASIGETIGTLEQFFAKQRGEPPPAHSKFQQQVADGRLTLQIAAQGLYRDPLSFTGQGKFELGGAQLARINLLGGLSQALRKNSLFNFTAIQLNSARSSFSLDHQRVEFPDFKIAGSSAAIEAKGTFLLDKKLMDFSAKVYPFEQGKTLFASAVGFVLVPISNALELKLSGTLDEPNWRFAYGPTNLIYNITGTKPNEADPNQPAPEKTKNLPPIYLRR